MIFDVINEPSVLFSRRKLDKPVAKTNFVEEGRKNELSSKISSTFNANRSIV